MGEELLSLGELEEPNYAKILWGFRHSYSQELEHFSSRQTYMGYFTPTTKALGSDVEAQILV